jgi:hypothetical protein
MTEQSEPVSTVADRDPALTLPLAEQAGWGELDVRAVDTV